MSYQIQPESDNNRTTLMLPTDNSDIADVDPDANVSPRNTTHVELVGGELPSGRELLEPGMDGPVEEDSKVRSTSPRIPLTSGQIAVHLRYSGADVEGDPIDEEDDIVDPASGQSSIQPYIEKISKLEGELQHYQLRVAGVGALVTMLSEKKEEAENWKDKAERLEIALSRQEHKSCKLEQEVKELREKYGDDSSKRSAPTLQPSRQILNTIMKENAQLKIAMNRLVGNGNAGYKEGLKMGELYEVIQDQHKQIHRLYYQLKMLRDGVAVSQNLSGFLPTDSGLGSTVSTYQSSSAPSSLSNVSSEVMMLRNEVVTLQEKLGKRETFIETLSTKLSQYQTNVGGTPDGPAVTNEQDKPVSNDKSNSSELEGKLKSLSSEMEEKDKVVRDLSAQLETVRAQFVAQQKENQELERKFTDSYPTVERLTQDVAHLKSMMSRKDRENRELLEKLRDTEKKLEQSTKEKPTSESGPSNVVEELKKYRSKNAHLVKELEDLNLQYEVSKSDFQKFEVMRDELEAARDQIRALSQEKRILKDQLQSSQQNTDAILAQFEKVRELMQGTQGTHSRGAINPASIPGMHTGMVSGHRGLILPSESHFHGEQSLITVRDSGPNSESTSYDYRQHHQGPPLQTAHFMYNEVAARTSVRRDMYPPSSHQQQQVQQTQSYQSHSFSPRPYDHQDQLQGHITGPSLSSVPGRQPNQAQRYGGQTQGGYTHTARLVPSGIPTTSAPTTSTAQTRAYLTTSQAQSGHQPFVAESRDNSGSGGSFYRTNTRDNY